MSDVFDVAFIGAGPAGYVGAIKAAQLGLKTVCIDKRGVPGGTCLNVGCIPSKALLHASEAYHDLEHRFAQFGVNASGVSFDLAKMMAHKDDTVSALTKGISGLFKKNAVTWLAGAARFTAADTLSVTAADGSTQTVRAKSIVIATGSAPANLPGITVDEQTVVSSTGALKLAAVPKRLTVIGAGYIGLEMGSVWRRLGSEVTVVEFLDRITPGMDSEIAGLFKKSLEKQGFVFKLGTKVIGVTPGKDGLNVALEAVADGAKSTLAADVVLVATGRVPYTADLGLAEVGIATDERGRVGVDAHYRTSVGNVYAVGDVIVGPMLAHKAEEEAVAVAEMLAGKTGHVNYNAIPGVVYTDPEVAGVGKTEDELKAAGVAYKVGKFAFLGNGRARAMLRTEGTVKILTEAATDTVLGVHIIGPDAGHLIAEAVLAMEFGASAEDLARTCHAHPTLSEAVKEAALAAFAKPIHA